MVVGFKGCGGGLSVDEAELIEYVDHSHPRMPTLNCWIIRYLEGIVDARVKGCEARSFDVLHRKKIVLAAIE